MDFLSPRPRILISNDDGINAPGLRALVAALHAADFCDIAVCGPAGERSAQSHAITLRSPMLTFPIEVEGTDEAYAVEGTPADSVMLALHGPVLKNPRVDLVISGINRGENCGLHIIYSGTVGAAREAAAKDIPALAVSLDDYSAKSEEPYKPAAEFTAILAKAILGCLPGLRNVLEDMSQGSLINVNVPRGPASGIKGFYMAHQSASCTFPRFVEVADQPTAASEAGELKQEAGVPNGKLPREADGAGVPGRRLFRNMAGELRRDAAPGSDTWAVEEGWVAVTPLGLRSDFAFGEKIGGLHTPKDTLPQTVAEIIEAAASHLGLKTGGIPGSPARL